MASKRILALGENQVREEKKFCRECSFTGFQLDGKTYVENDFEYGPTAYPCPNCNPNPPQRRGE